MHRASGALGSEIDSVVKPQDSTSKTFISYPSKQNEITTFTQKENSTEKENTQGLAKQQQQPVGKALKGMQPTMPEDEDHSSKQKAVETPQNPTISGAFPTKSAPPPPTPKQDCGAPNAKPSASNSDETVSKKMVDLGSPLTTPKMSTTAVDIKQITPSVSPKIAPMKDKPDVAKKPVPPTLAQLTAFPEIKAVESLSESVSAVTEVKQGASETGLSVCPLCKVELNNSPPNFSTCTECKCSVCNLCGFVPVPRAAAVRVVNISFVFFPPAIYCMRYTV